MVLLVPAAFIISREPYYRSSAVLLVEARLVGAILIPPYVPSSVNSMCFEKTVLDNLSKTSLQELQEVSNTVVYRQWIRDAYVRWRGVESPPPDPSHRALAALGARVSFQRWPGDRGPIISGITVEASHPAPVDIVNAYIATLLFRMREFDVDDAQVSRLCLEQGEVKVKVIDPPGPAIPIGHLGRMRALTMALAVALGVAVSVPLAVEWIHR
jgi:hypothetical protein